RCRPRPPAPNALPRRRWDAVPRNTAGPPACPSSSIGNPASIDGLPSAARCICSYRNRSAGYAQVGALLLPPVERCLRDPQLPNDLLDRSPAFSLPKSNGNLSFREPFLHPNPLRPDPKSILTDSHAVWIRIQGADQCFGLGLRRVGRSRTRRKPRSAARRWPQMNRRPARRIQALAGVGALRMNSSTGSKTRCSTRTTGLESLDPALGPGQTSSPCSLTSGCFRL
ncbi:hypothetical protein LCGC14_1906670, partial [marine sediment metagenome]